MTAREHRNLGIKTRTTLSRDPQGYCRIFPNPVGTGVVGKIMREGRKAQVLEGRVVKYGLCPGSSDQVGYVSIIITPEMVGTRKAIFVGFEDKTGKATLQRNQKNFSAMILRAGGIAGTVRKVQDAKDLLLAAGADPKLFEKRKRKKKGE